MHPERIEVAMTVKAYPALSKRRGEQVCIAGIRTDQVMAPSWIRLYPYPFRDMPESRQFKKWDVVSIIVSDAVGDNRPESHTPNPDTLEHIRSLGTERGWADRRPLVEPLVVGSMCEFLRLHELDGRSLGAVAVSSVDDVTVAPVGATELADLRQRAIDQDGTRLLLGNDKRPLEPVPFEFRYEWRCDGKCPGHRHKIVDWEINQAWRGWTNQGYDSVPDRIRQKWLSMCEPTKDTVFFMGNVHRFPDVWMVLGTYYPARG